jgi:hypothetical protein
MENRSVISSGNTKRRAEADNPGRAKRYLFLDLDRRNEEEAMEVATSDKGRPRGNVLLSEQGTINRRSWSASRYAGRESAYGDRTIRLIVDFLAGLFALWLSLTVLELIGLSEMNHQVLSLSLIFVASALALMICIIGSPLFVPVCCLCGNVSLVIEECLSPEMAVMHDCGVFIRYCSVVDRRADLFSSGSQAIDFSKCSSSNIRLKTCGGSWRHRLLSRSDC